jgi:hypothetical protein
MKYARFVPKYQSEANYFGRYSYQSFIPNYQSNCCTDANQPKEDHLYSRPNNPASTAYPLSIVPSKKLSNKYVRLLDSGALYPF